jgi:acetoacetyl-CoA synthetase
MTDPLWTPAPERVARANLTAFAREAERRHGLALPDYASLYRWSIEQPEAFWQLIWDRAGVIGEPGARVLIDADRMPGARWFPDARLNFAENLLRRNDDSDALVFRGENKVQRRLSWRELHAQVSGLQQVLRAAGVGPGDRVAAFLPNCPETVIGMLATASLGATFSSCSPDFGVRGVLDRFGQIEPKVLIGVEGYYYNGKTLDCLDKLRGVMAELPTVERLIVVPYTRERPPLDDLPKATLWNDTLAEHPVRPVEYTRQPFNQPLYIMFSSGTTGVPKCIVHGAGGTLLQHLKEHQLHTDVQPGDRVFYFTTCGWMMWNWLVSGLASQATLLLYDGSPFYPSGNVLFDYAEQEKMSVFGTSAKYIDALAKAELKPRETHDLSTVRAMLSTGSPLVPESFDYVYRDIKPDLQLSSISGGTDILSCFALGNPVLPVWRGELQCRGLGLAVEVWDDEGNPLPPGEKGELVCVKPFPSMPVGFWNDPDGSRYRGAYFERFPGVWCHGDYVALTEHGGLIIYGRSDAVLNPGGVRIGTAEIYRQVEQIDEVLESLVIGQDWRSDVRVVLFVRLRDGLTLDEALIDRIKRQIRANTTPRHVPAKVIQVADIPRTKSGKIVELAVRDIVHGRPIKNREALANPEALELYRDLPELGR